MGGAQFRALAHPDRRGGKPLLEFLGIDFAQAFFAEDVLRDAFHVSGDRGVKRSEAVVARGSQNQDGLEGEGEGNANLDGKNKPIGKQGLNYADIIKQMENDLNDKNKKENDNKENDNKENEEKNKKEEKKSSFCFIF